VSCGASEQSNAQPIKVQLSKGVDATVTVGYDNEHGRFALKNDTDLGRMFDGKPETYWISETKGCQKVGFSIVKENPSYLKRVRIIHHGKIFPTVGSVIVDQTTSEDTYTKSGRDVKLDLSTNQELDVGEEYYPSVLKGRVFSLFLLDCNQAGGKLEIAEIKFEFSDTPTMKPVLTAKEIKTAVKALIKPNAKSWNFADDEKEPNKEKYLSHLMYYGLRGDAEAENLFLSYIPHGTDLNEEQSEIESWYTDDKKSQHKVPQSN
jgi:hypothetical protein